MWPYNAAEQPPAPFLALVVYHPERTTQTIQIEAKIDTGADISALPSTIVQQLGLPVTSKLVVEGYDGVLATVSSYAAGFTIESVQLEPHEIIAIPETYALLGRDVLNNFYLYLKGPDLVFELSRHPF
jgi:predicted aspartyl protease